MITIFIIAAVWLAAAYCVSSIIRIEVEHHRKIRKTDRLVRDLGKTDKRS